MAGVSEPMPACRRQGRRRALVTAAVAVGLTVAGTLPLVRGAGASPLVDVVVRGTHGGAAAAAGAVRDVGGRVVRNLAIIDGAAARVPASRLVALMHHDGVAQVTPDAPVHLESTTAYDPTTDVGSIFDTTLMTGAQAYWKAGWTGRGVDVALIDSGVVPVNGLSASGKVLHGPDLSFESQAPNLRHLDTYGHGTHVAGLIAGRDDAATGAYAGDSADFVGMAPDARIVSVKVADSHGITDVSQVLAGIDWVVQHRADSGLNIRVLNLSFGTDSYQSYLYDPLSYAAETAWHDGIVVVAATGNAGWKSSGILDPADNPYLIAVGAADTMATASTADDTVAAFSSAGDGRRNPDLVAPGIHMESLRDPNSYIDATYPGGLITDRFFRGSGTSQAAAVVSGAAALVLQQHPLLTPDQVKALLTQTATPVVGQTKATAGAGELNLASALTAVPPVLAVQLWVHSSGTGTLEGARGSVHLTQNGVTLSGEKDIFGSPVNTTLLAAQLGSGTAWTGGVFNGVAWTGSGFVGSEWASSSWSSSSWSSSSWSSSSWSSSSWSSSSWSSSSWSSSSWSSSSWSSSSWSSSSWS